MASQDPIDALRRAGALLDEAIALADAAGETLIGAHLSQAMDAVDTRFDELHAATAER